MIKITNAYPDNTVVVVRGDRPPIVVRPGETAEVLAQSLRNVSVLIATEALHQ